MNINLYLSRSELMTADLTNSIAVVIDVLRATSTICTAFSNGCESVIPVAEVQKAREIARSLPENKALLCGERNEQPIEGFDLSNSPLEYTRNIVNGKIIVFTSTNGSQLFQFSKKAQKTVVSSFLNVTTVSDYLCHQGANVSILCAGKYEQFGLEDAVCGGMIIEQISLQLKTKIDLNDGAFASNLLYKNYADSIHKMLMEASHGRRLIQIGQEQDLIECSKVDSKSVLPILNKHELQLNE